jgi:hypothetical protein
LGSKEKMESKGNNWALKEKFWEVKEKIGK